MANHGYIFHCKEKITEELVRDLATKFTKEKLKGILTLEEKGEGNFFLRFDEYNGIDFWISDYEDSYWEEEKFDGDRKTCIEIRHGHHGELHSFMWWIDWELQNYLAYHLKGRLADDGVGLFDEEPEDRELKYSESLLSKNKPRMMKIFGWLEWRSLRTKYPQFKQVY